MRNLIFEVPGEPVGKGRPRFTRTGRAYTPDKTVRYENLVVLSFRETYPDWDPVDGPIAVRMTAFFPIARSWSQKKKGMAIRDEIRPTKKPDTDNIAKIKDALNGIVWHDDAQVVEETIAKYYSDNPRLIIEILMLEDEIHGCD